MNRCSLAVSRTLPVLACLTLAGCFLLEEDDREECQVANGLSKQGSGDAVNSCTIRYTDRSDCWNGNDYALDCTSIGAGEFDCACIANGETVGGCVSTICAEVDEPDDAAVGDAEACCGWILLGES